MSNRHHLRAASCLTAVLLLSVSTMPTRSQSFLIDKQSATVNWSNLDIQFSLTFNVLPDFTVDQFQYYTPDSLIRGGEINTAADTIPIRSYGPSQSDPASGGWGPIVATVPYKLSGETITFSAPFSLFSSSPAFEYQVETYYQGAMQDIATGSSVPEPTTWALMTCGILGLGLFGYRRNSLVPAPAA